MVADAADVARDLAAARRLCTEAECMLRVLTEYVPACFALGFLVRECNWAGHGLRTAHVAKDVLLYALCVVLRLAEGAPHKLEYFRSLTAALLTWTSWHDALPASLFTEEFNEAGLSRLGALCKTHPQLVEVEAVSDLYCGGVRPGESPPTAHHPTRALCDAVQANVDRLTRSTAPVVTYAGWLSGGKTVVARAEWPEGAWFPGTLWRKERSGDLQDMLRYTVRLLLQG